MRPVQIGLVAGWAHDASALDGMAAPLRKHYSVHTACVGDWAPDAVSGFLGWLGAMPDDEDVCLVGWSMGAMVIFDALRAIRMPWVRCVVSLSGAARFTRAEGMADGWDAAPLRAMQRALVKDPGNVLRNFFAMADQPGRLVDIEVRVAKALTVGIGGLSSGLEYLETTDLRDDIPSLDYPILCWHGGEDGVIPASRSEWLAKKLPRCDLLVQPGLGHSGPIQTADAIAVRIDSFIRSQGL